jgi:2-dehydropantoate 2-reductase
MRFAILGSGAVGGYHGAKLARAGHDVTFIARGAHLAAIREKGLEVRSPMLGDFTVRARAEQDTAKVGPVDVVIVAVKAYDNPTALPLVTPMIGPRTMVLTLQNGVDSAVEVASLEQTGTHRRIVFGEVFGSLPRVSDRVREIHDALTGADIVSEPVADGRVPIWEKFIFLVTLAGFTGAARLPIGPLWSDPAIRARFLDGCREVERLARSEGVPVAEDVIDRISTYVDGIPGSMRSSLLIDLSQGKRTEVEALQGSVVRRAARAGIPVPITATLYAVLKPFAAGAPQLA